MKTTTASLVFAIVISLYALGQDVPPGPGAPGQPPDSMMMAQFEGGPQSGGPQGPGNWWKDPEMVERLGLTDDQAKKIGKIAQDHRIQEIDLRADLEKQEASLSRLVEADQPDESQVMTQADKAAQARAALEKSNLQMLLAVRRVLSVEQAKKLRDLRPMPPFMGGPGPGRPPEPVGPPPAN